MVRTRGRGRDTQTILDLEESSFARLLEALAEPAPTDERRAREVVRDDEFTCSRCHLVLHVTRLVDADERRCVDCAPRAAAAH